MKLSEFSTDKALDILCELTPYINNIATDESLTNELKAKISNKGTTRAEVIAAGAAKVNRLIPIILKTHRGDVYGILSVMNEMTVDAIAAQNALKTASQIRDIAKDRELVDFFKSCAKQD